MAIRTYWHHFENRFLLYETFVKKLVLLGALGLGHRPRFMIHFGISEKRTK